jgi:hypothetical protein
VQAPLESQPVAAHGPLVMHEEVQQFLERQLPEMQVLSSTQGLPALCN